MDAVKLLGALLGNNATGGNLLGSILGGGGQAAPQQAAGPAGLLKGILGGGGGAAQQSGGGGLGGLLGGGGASEPEPEVAPPQRQAANDQATTLIRAMCNAAKADGNVDQAEQQAIIGRLGELDQNEVDFLKQELASPLDENGFARSVPQELGPQVYALSVMTVKVDTREEVQYLTQLAQGLGLNQQTLDAIHQQAGLA